MKSKLRALKTATLLASYPVDAYANMVQQAISMLGSKTPHLFRDMLLTMKFDKLFDLGASGVEDDVNKSLPAVSVCV